MTNSKKAPQRTRSTADMTTDSAATQGLTGGNPRDPKKRPERIPMQEGKKLGVNFTLDEENFHYHYFLESDTRAGRIESAKGAYYEIVTDEQGVAVSKASGADKLVLMRLPIEFYQQDMLAKRKRNQQTMDDQTKLKDNEYAPTKTRAEGGDSSVTEHKETDNAYAS